MADTTSSPNLTPETLEVLTELNASTDWICGLIEDACRKTFPKTCGRSLIAPATS